MKLCCVACGEKYAPYEGVRYFCDCGESLEAVHDIEALKERVSRKLFDDRLRKDPFGSGVWRYKELILPKVKESDIITRKEGNTRLYSSTLIDDFTGCNKVLLKHEGENPTGSFKDRGMTVGMTVARILGMSRVACASTGNTSASMASYASSANMESVVFIPKGKIAYGKLAQALAYGAKTLQIKGDFDDAMRLVKDVCSELGYYLLNSLNPFRIEGQKAICFETLQQLKWEVPDWFILPGGNLGNNTALSKALKELYELGIIDKIPRLAVIQAHGANPLYRMWKSDAEYKPVKNADTIATAIKIGNPVNWRKSLAGIRWCKGVVEEVTDQEILDAKARVDRAGIGAEPASCATVAGLKKLVRAGVIQQDESVVGILTGNILKDPDIAVGYHSGTLKGFDTRFANKPIVVECDLESVRKVLG